MSNNNSNLPLHKVTHWRKLKFSVGLVLKMEGVSKSGYNFNNIRCYRTIGSELQGKNMRFLDGCKHSPWVSDNEYDVYEIPEVSNHSSIKSEGTFFVLAHNTSFNYWVAGELKVSINTQMTINQNHFHEDCSFRPVGIYEIGGDNSGDVVVYKKKAIYDIDCGYPLPHSFNNTFDSFGARKKAYGLSEPSIIFKLKHSEENTKFISDTTPVKKYKKKKK